MYPMRGKRPAGLRKERIRKVKGVLFLFVEITSPKLTSNLKHSCLSLANAGIISIHDHVWFDKYFFKGPFLLLLQRRDQVRWIPYSD